VEYEFVETYGNAYFEDIKAGLATISSSFRANKNYVIKL